MVSDSLGCPDAGERSVSGGFSIVRIAILALGLLVVGGAVWLVWQVAREGYYSDPAAVREPDAWVELDAGPEPMPAVDWSIAESLKVSTNEVAKGVEDAGDVEITFNATNNPPKGPFNYTVHRVEATESLRVDGGTIRLDSIGVAYGAFPSDRMDSHSVRMEGRFFEPDLQPMSPERLNEAFPNEWDRKVQFDGSFPGVKVRLAIENLGGVKNLGAKVLDARTGQRLVSGYSYGADEGGAFCEFDLEMWHAAPVLVALDIGHGPTEIREVTPEIGATFHSSSGSLRLVAIIEGDQHGSSSTSDNGVHRHTLRIDRDSDKSETAFVFLGSPRAHPVPLDFEFIGKDGKKLRGGGGSSGTHLKVVSAQAKPSEIAKIRAIHYPHLKRVIVRLPKIPGLPEANQAIDNLFDIRIPYLRVRREWQLRELVQQLVQMKVDPYASAVPDGYFPRVYTNATPKELLVDYLELCPPHESIRIDQEALEIELSGPFWEEWWVKLWQFFQ